MSNSEIVTSQIPASTEERTKIDVSIAEDKAIIRMSSFADGIGWFTQKTITVDAEMLDELHSKISEACGKIHRETDDILAADLLEF